MGIDGLSIRPAIPGDCPALEPLVAQLGYPVTVADLEDRLSEMRTAGLTVFVAELHGRIVGCLSTSMMQVLHRPQKVGRISMMVVDETSRGSGIGRALVRHAEAHLVSRGCGLVEVTSNIRRADAHRFYERLGYQKTSVRLAHDCSTGGTP